MDKVVSYEQIQDMVKQIRTLKNGFVTNFYWDDQKHPYWIIEGSLCYEAKPDCYILVHQANEFSNIYYITTNIRTFLRHFTEIELENDIVLDVITKGDDIDFISVFLSYGFEEYKHLFRMIHTGLMTVEEEYISNTIISANKKDIEALKTVLYDCFDPLAEQLPSNMELSDYIDKDEIFLVRDKDTICGFIIFEIIGVTWYLRYWYTSPDYRNLGIGASLLKASLIRGNNTKRQILWVMSHNENAIKRYEHYGFKRELLNDYVLVKRKQR
jgi:ribosomal protein S18 acetylase RimI-like enzyme